MADRSKDTSSRSSTSSQLADAGLSKSNKKTDRLSNRPPIPYSTVVFKKNKSDLVSYEDLLVTQYLEEIKSQKVKLFQPKIQAPVSPYLQRISNIDYNGRPRVRPRSAVACVCSGHGKQQGGSHKISWEMDCSRNTMAKSMECCCHESEKVCREKNCRVFSAIPGSCCCPPAVKPKIDAKFIADPSLWDPATPRNPHHSRPVSAPVKRLRPPSGSSRKLRPFSAHRMLSRNHANIIKVCAYVNGSREKFAHLAAPTMAILLEMATEKLGLPFAARRVFLENGREIFTANDFFESEAENIFVSMGESFKNPDLSTKKNMDIKNCSVWTLAGITMSEKVKNKGTKAKMTKRLKTLYKNNKIRIIIYVNGSSTDANEVIADVDNFNGFLVACTAKLNLSRHAKIVYDWNGKQITNLSEISFLDDIIMPQKTTPIGGPVWISTGERLSPSGVRGYLMNLQTSLKEKLKVKKNRKQQIDFALNDNKEQVTDPKVLAIADEDLYEALEKTEEDIEKLKNNLSSVKERLEELESEAMKEEDEGLNYRLTHIKTLAVDDRLVGLKGIKLKVFENGKSDGEFMYCFNLREANKGTDKNQVLLRLLDELSSTRFSAGVNRNLNAVATKLFDKEGREITDVFSLQPEQSVWLSFGEPFINPSTYCLHLFLDKATQITTDSGETKIAREAITGSDEELLKDTSKWEAYSQFPDCYENKEQYDDGKKAYLLENAQLDANSHYLLHKEKHDLAIYPEISISEKASIKNQVFIYTEAGYLSCKAMPQMCLAVSNEKTEVQLVNSNTSVDGFIVCIQKKIPNTAAQIWHCLPDATIYSEAYPSLLLTYTGQKRWDANNDESSSNQDNSVKNVSLIVTYPQPKKLKGLQRFAFKQERFDNLGQWKFTDTNNPDWHKYAYSWPVKTNGELNKNYDWPMEGYIIPNVPPLLKSSAKLGLTGVTPARLKVLRNGERNADVAISVVGPNITNLVKDNSKKELKHKHKKAVKEHFVEYSENEDINILPEESSVFQTEFQMFLAQCTSLLNLPFAARRLFDFEGKELFTIQNLSRDSLVYVSCGESWSDPKLTKSEQRRRFLLSQITSDVMKIQQFCSMRNPENFVLEISGPLAPESGLVVNQRWTPDLRESQSKVKQSIDNADDNQINDGEENDDGQQEPRELSFHELSHLKSDEYVSNLKWPWEKLVNVSNSMDTEDPEANKYSDRDMYMKFRPQMSPRLSREAYQKFTYEDGYIAVLANRTMVLSLSKSEGRVVNVVLAKRQPDDINQRWTIKANGEIISRAHQSLVLTVSLPPTSSGELSQLSFYSCPITVQPRCNNQYGKAHQKWKYDPESGYIFAFDTDLLDKEITAAIRADVCTYAVILGLDVDQPGYFAEITKQGREGTKQIKVCVSCARSMRGRFKVQKLPPGTSFHCAMGDAKKLRIQHYGSFKQLNNKVDLSTHEAEVTLMHLMKSLESLKQQTSVHSIEKEIHAFRSVKLVKVLAYKNGEGRLRKGEIICGSSIEGILSQCNHRLGLTSAARRMYLEDGTLVLDVDDLIRYVEENYKSEMINILWSKKSEKSGTEEANTVTKENEEEDEAVQLQKLHEAASKEIDRQMRKSLDKIMNMTNAGIEGLTEEDEVKDKQQEEEEQKDLDNEEAQKIYRQRKELYKEIQLPPLDVILKMPIEVWVSSGKAFISPEVVESKEENRRKRRIFRSQVCLELDIEKHVLRLMKGRRLEQMSPGVYRSTLSSTQPVVLERHWKEQTVEEKDKHETVYKLQAHLGEIKEYQKDNSHVTGIRLDGKLYQQPNMKRVLVYQNGDHSERYVYVWGSSIEEILDSATSKLSMWKRARTIYTQEGVKIENFNDIQRDQILCISSGKSFRQANCEKKQIEMKANWCRASRNQKAEIIEEKHSEKFELNWTEVKSVNYELGAADAIVTARKHPHVNVDPFGPPLLALPPGSNNFLEK
ncbi:doublecortin domain-containing protein 1 [Biomphalaria glabrata]|uniref:Doublecortin domain-containing protein 1-like isoform X1 n=1 Tax=Biomphalaria glabrata TaxID=6526 RepID=A0A9W3BKS4_BIOGL|nr:doublecortin domain-containing protein 1-like isoform X1 [Biomphalaria glabrata]KAI8760091.1 doublecortin domain-containing protein 1 [Biomphalaria glabrata]